MSKAHKIVKNGLSLQGFFRLFPTDLEAEAWFVEHRWPNGVECPHCGSDNIATVRTRKPQPYRCRTCRRHFSHTTNTPMHSSNLGPQTWLLALMLTVSNPKQVSSVQIAALCEISQPCAWHLGHRLREMMAAGHLPGFDSVQVDETWIGGKAKNRHKSKPDPGKQPVVAVIDNDTGTAVATPVHEVTTETATAMVEATTNDGATVHTDGSPVYDKLTALGYDHERVIHSINEYVRSDGVTTNSVENFWSLLKRSYVGTFHWWSHEHTHRYVDAHTFLFNNRKCHVTDRMSAAVRSGEGRRLTWEALTAAGPSRQECLSTHG